MFADLCRVCLSSNIEQLESLFIYAKGVESYAELLSFSCGIEINPNDRNFPQFICKDCASKIVIASEVRRKCFKTDTFLRLQIVKSEGEPASETEPPIFLQEDTEVLEVSPSINSALKLLGEVTSEETRVQTFDTQPKHELSRLRSPSKRLLVSHRPAKDNLKKPPKKTALKPPNVTSSDTKKPEQQDYKCFICDEVFDLISAKDLHVKQVHSDSRLCRICNRRKQTATALENHLRFHVYGYRFLCSECGKSFRFKNLLDNHLKVEHYEEVKFSCDICLYETKFKINLERHLKSVHMKIRNFKCSTCQAEYSTQVGLNLHLYRIHKVEAPVTCSGCSQGFTFDSELRMHKKHCTGSSIRLQKARPQDAQVDILENGFQCRVCKQIFDARSKWSVHFHHKHKASNVCSICDKQLASSTSLLKHVQVKHNQIKKFQCDICLKSFGFKHSLEGHKNTHTGQKPYACNLCNFRAGDRSAISKHKKKAHVND